jgi:hypothetical protein
MADVDKGALVLTIGIYPKMSRQYRNMLLVNLILVAVLPIVFYFGFSTFIGADDAYSAVGAMLVFLLISWGFLYFQWFVYRIVQPVKVYEKGLEFKLCLAHRLIGRPAFVPKEELDGVYLVYTSQEAVDKADPKKAFRITFTGVQKRRAYSALARPAVDLLRAAEHAEKEWKLPVYNKPRPYKIKVSSK